MKKITPKTLYKALFKGTNLFLILLMIDYITTLFSLNETATVVSKLGIVFKHIETDAHISTSFSIDIKLIISYCIVILIAFIFEILHNRKNDKFTS